ncbi:hypothetical protein ACJX0J_004132 [Zea mays]
MEALVYTKAYKIQELQWIYEKIFLIKKEIFFLPIFGFLFEEPLPFIFWHYYHKEEILDFSYFISSSFEPFFLISVENFKYGELHLLSKLLQVGIITWSASVGQSTLTRFYSLHTFVVTCHLDTSLQLRSIFIQIVEADYGSYGNAFIFFQLIMIKFGWDIIIMGNPRGPNDLLYIFPVVILGTIAGTSFPYFKYSVFFSLGIFRLLPSESSLDT